MQITRLPLSPEEGDVERRDREVAVGTFDGVHLGHREVIRGADSVLTFDPHPATVLTPQRAPRLLTSLERKAELIAGLGVRELIVIPFDAAFAQRSAEEFIEGVLLGTLRARRVSVGANFHFGRRAQGSPAMLLAQGRLSTTVHELLEIDGEVVSSSRIRELVLAGEVARAGELLGAPLRIEGEVLHGDRRGRELGFPTANLLPDPRMATPARGVYACLAPGGPKPGDTRLRRESPFRPAAVNIGVRPTFQTDGGELIEAHLIDFSGELYGERLKLDFIARLREERRFESAQALIEQMRLDVQEARALAGAWTGSATVPDP
ncbi:MAG TPA: bifunctional riboflavin kinase/FAD synthetase [Solirubrobacteraceae bacterium]|nr:bifunctional riboflavin kinase/FAD synthetase [Solirubrobacteraceae bacterium]